MATVVLQTAGAIVGTFIGGPLGGTIGQTLGALAGSAIDQKLFGPGDRTVSAPRLENVGLLSSGEGNAIARVYGTARVAGEIIWATRFEEVISRKKASGGKGGGPKTTVQEYSYFANLAIGLCQGPIGGIGRIWADGDEIDKSSLTLRFYNGTEDQAPDALIEAKQGSANTPAYRGLAYLVLETFPLADYGNRIPQIAVEIINPIGTLERNVRAVNLIPGSTEFGYDTEPVVVFRDRWNTDPLNTNQNQAPTDFLASLDLLQACCPNLEQINIVATWFGDDLRAEECRLEPRVEVENRVLKSGTAWRSGGIDRSSARLVSQTDDELNFGGTPSDQSIVNAIREIKSRGLRVGITPFIQMDIPSGNGLADPYGATEQAAFPWRGRITTAEGPGSASVTNRSAIEAFVGAVASAQIIIGNDEVRHPGVTEWSYRRFIIHYARLAELAGGVDQFLIGSEMKELTRLRDETDAFPFVEALIDLAADVRPIVGPDCLVTYAADWSEYFHYQPSDGSGDLFYNLDPLWASSDIDAVGIDFYMPISDHRDDDPSSSIGPNDPSYLSGNIEAGEGYDWFYASAEDRSEGLRTPITDGLGKPWTFRFKDLRNWRANQHFERRGGVELPTPTAWQTDMKPFVFCELGCPAVHNGATRPNVFPDPKSSENALPYFSNGQRDDEMQAAYLNAVMAHYDTHHSFWSGAPGEAPATGIVDMGSCALWAWDARPFPTFPSRADVWSDGENWLRGHWLNGRMGRLRLADLIARLLTEAGETEIDTSRVEGIITGFAIASLTSPRAALEAIIDVYGIDVLERDGILTFVSRNNSEPVQIEEDCLAREGDGALVTELRAQMSELPSALTLRHWDRWRDYQQASSSVRNPFVSHHNLSQFSLPIVADDNELIPILDGALLRAVDASHELRFSVSSAELALSVGDTVRLPWRSENRSWRISEIEEGDVRRIRAVAVSGMERTAGGIDSVLPRVPSGSRSSATISLVLMNLPLLTARTDTTGNMVASAASPWPGQVSLLLDDGGGGGEVLQTLAAPATIGELASDLAASRTFSRWLHDADAEVQLASGDLSSAVEHQVFAGANALSIGSNESGFEILQFRQAIPQGDGRWLLRGLLRGQAGTEDIAAEGHSGGAQVVLLDRAVEPLESAQAVIGRPQTFYAVPAGQAITFNNRAVETFEAGTRHLRPYSPVHLRYHFEPDGALILNWIRRDRSPNDDWSFSGRAMSEAREHYLVSLTSPTGSLELNVYEPSASITQSQWSALADSQVGQLDVSVAQMSATVGAGIPAHGQITFPQF